LTCKATKLGPIGVDKYCSGGYLLVSETHLNKQQLTIAKNHCSKLLIQVSLWY